MSLWLFLAVDIGCFGCFGWRVGISYLVVMGRGAASGSDRSRELPSTQLRYATGRSNYHGAHIP